MRKHGGILVQNGGPWEWVGGSGVDPGRRGRGGGKPPPEDRREFPGINAVNVRDFIRPVPRGYGGFNGLTPLPPTHK